MVQEPTQPREPLSDTGLQLVEVPAHVRPATRPGLPAPKRTRDQGQRTPPAAWIGIAAGLVCWLVAGLLIALR